LVSATNNYNDGETAYTSLSAGYQSILYGTIFGTNTPAPTVTINNLVAGDDYTVRFWVYDGVDYAQNLTITSNGVSSNPASEGSNAGDLGSYLTATFVADSSTQSFSFTNSDNYNPGINALEVLQSVPEPSTVALMAAGAGLIGLAAVRRLRLAAI
jgi:hypothetical protein